MQKILLAYSSRDGQTQKILTQLEKQWAQEANCDWYDLHGDSEVNWAQYDRVIVAASIRYGRFHQCVYQFVSQYQLELGQMPAAFLCVNLTARKPGKDLPENSVYIKKFLKQSPWQPKQIAIFAGALRYPKYRWFDRVMIQLIMKMTGGETDTRKEVEYTDWQKVGAFGETFIEK
ncbi:menaquinone-dependent protoporphyrinogen IX dehydrogenase [Thaumasiovibrio subtropicus]|uniref:menaquinone-dependent protoporphyrinogen IX dehydrogenase n=1 Tax=Thaumasiovibrio subtropicus TaxID=1891207 RepID=UPI000B35784C|nr:menaquinone-dependent protoporphyrinogen IX dehydrogenase [Thaumasiovibrio subtropicus]